MVTVLSVLEPCVQSHCFSDTPRIFLHQKLEHFPVLYRTRPTYIISTQHQMTPKYVTPWPAQAWIWDNHTLLWAVTLSSLVDGYQQFGETCRLPLLPWRWWQLVCPAYWYPSLNYTVITSSHLLPQSGLIVDATSITSFSIQTEKYCIYIKYIYIQGVSRL